MQPGRLVARLGHWWEQWGTGHAQLSKRLLVLHCQVWLPPPCRWRSWQAAGRPPAVLLQQGCTAQNFAASREQLLWFV